VRIVAAAVIAVGPPLGDLSLIAAHAAEAESAEVRSNAGATQTLEWALAQAYQNNPQLNSQRAQVRQQDEGVPQALSGYRPRITGQANAGIEYVDTSTKATVPQGTVYTQTISTFPPRGVQLTATQTLYNGMVTANSTRAAESQVSAARETLRLVEQQVLLNAATSYLNVLQNGAIVDLNKRNVEVLTEQLRQTRDRFNVGEVTKTDVAQAESRLAAGRSQLHQAESDYMTSKAAFRQNIGVEPGRLAPATPVDRLSPRTLAAAVSLGKIENPNVTAAMMGVDVALLNVKINEGALYPVLQVQGQVVQNYEPQQGIARQLTAAAVGTLTVPIYQQGTEYSKIRQSKEALGQRRIDVDTQRDQVQAGVVQAWGQLEAGKAQIVATQAQVNAAEIALNGVREEARVGQRTTLDVLNAQQELVNARVALVTAQRNRIVASYSLLFNVGRLNAAVLRLHVPTYDPIVHYEQVRDSWIGVRNPDGR